MLKFSTRALKAIPKLFSYRNDVDIYTEDKIADKEFYKSLFNNLFEGNLKLNDITPLGSKANVYDEFDNQDQDDGRRKYYIVDGDLDLITGTNRAEEGNLIVLDSYCIENYLIDEKGMAELTYLSCGTVPKDQIIKKINFDKWIGYNSDCLCELFCHLALSKKIGADSKIRNANEFIMIQSKQRILNKTKIKSYTEVVKKDILDKYKALGIQSPEEKYIEEIQALFDKWERSNENTLKIVSGKSYLLPLLQFRINFCIGKGKGLIPTESIKLFLAKNSSLSRLKYLTKRIN